MIPKRFMKDRRRRMVKIMIEEMETWESTTKVSPEELFKLADRLYKELK